VITDLGTLGGNWSYANGINNQNVIVGGSFVDPSDAIYHAFVTQGTRLVDLNSLLDASGAGWTLVEARAINDLGQIVGIGTYGGVRHAFRLNPVTLPNPVPTIMQHPTNLTVACQANASFSVVAMPEPLSYQWYKGSPPNGSILSNATSKTLTLPSVTTSQAGGYYVVAANAFGAATSSVATLTFSDSAAPVITGCPANLTHYTAPGKSTAVVTWPAPTATDNCDGTVIVACTPASGSTFAKGITTVTCQATDSSRNASSCTFTVTVLEKEAPQITAIMLSGADVLISFTTIKAAQYAVEVANSLQNANWTSYMSGMVGNGSAISITDSGAAAISNRFYRVRLLTP
jgi:hypothetical protein